MPRSAAPYRHHHSAGIAVKGFYSLPLEIRNQIYGYLSPSLAVLSTTLGKITIKECRRSKHEYNYQTKSLRILNLSNRIREEASLSLYQTSTFAIRPYLLLPHLRVSGTDVGSTRKRRYSSLDAIHRIRKWFVDLEKGVLKGSISPSKEYLQVVHEVAATLKGSPKIDLITVQFCCPCRLSETGYQVEKTTGDLSRVTPTLVKTGLQRFLAPLVELPNLGGIALDPTVHRNGNDGDVWSISFARIEKSYRRLVAIRNLLLARYSARKG